MNVNEDPKDIFGANFGNPNNKKKAGN